MIYDCASFFNELDLLEIRLNELDSVVDRFVIVEAELTHNGDAKPLYFQNNKARFAKFADKIIHVVVTRDDFKPSEQGSTFQERAWMRENIQRNAIAKAIADAKNDDIIIVSDLDEIPKASTVAQALASLKQGDVVGFVLNAYNFFANLRNVSDPFWGNDPKMATIGTFRNETAYATSPFNHFILQAINIGPTATRFRYIKPARRIANAGWHFSYLGGIKSAVAKVRAFNEVGLHSRKNLEEYIVSRITRGLALWGRDHFMPEPIDSRFPAFMLSNMDRFGYLFAPAPKRDTAWLAILRFWYRTSAALRRACMRVLFVLTPKWVRSLIKKMLGYNF